MKEGTRVLVGLGAGLALGLIVAASHNAALLNAADLVIPIGTLWVNAIRMTVIPLVVSLLITGVASASDISTIGRIGGRTLAVRLNRSIVALRGPEAAMIQVEDASHIPNPRYEFGTAT